MSAVLESFESRRLLSSVIPCYTGYEQYQPQVDPPTGVDVTPTSLQSAATATAPASLAGITMTLFIEAGTAPFKTSGSYVITFTDGDSFTATGGPGVNDKGTVNGSYTWLKTNEAGGGIVITNSTSTAGNPIAGGTFGGGFIWTSAIGGTFAFSGGGSDGSGAHSGTWKLGTQPQTNASISGNVFGDTNGNYVKGAGETGAQGWTVFLDTDNDGIVDAGEKATASDAQGNYSFTELTAGTYNVKIVKKIDFRVTAPGSTGKHVVKVADGQAVANKNFGVTNRSLISGIVFNDANGNGKRDTGEAGLKGVRIYMDSNNNGSYDTGENFVLTNAAGNYFLSAPNTGNVRIRQVAPTGQTTTQPSTNLHTVAATAGGSLFGRNFGAKANATSLNGVFSTRVIR